MWTIRGRVVALLAILGIVVAPAVVRANHFPDQPSTCESGADCIQNVSQVARETGKYFREMFGVIYPGFPLIMKSPPNATVVQQTYDRIYAARCDIPGEGLWSGGTWECEFTGDNNDFWIEVGVVRRVGKCDRSVYVYCNKCGSLGNEKIYQEIPRLDASTDDHFAQLWWEPPTNSPSSSTLGTWWVAWNGETIFNRTGPQANAAFAGSRTTHARNDLGVTLYLGLHYVLSDSAGVPYYKQFNGPSYWSFHDDPRYRGWRVGGGDFAVFTDWHQGGPTPTAVPSGDIGCNHS